MTVFEILSIIAMCTIPAVAWILKSLSDLKSREAVLEQRVKGGEDKMARLDRSITSSREHTDKEFSHIWEHLEKMEERIETKVDELTKNFSNIRVELTEIKGMLQNVIDNAK